MFKQYLHMVRLNWPALNEKVDFEYDSKDYADDEGLFSIYLRASDYEHMFARNLLVILSCTAVILIVWVTLAIIDAVTQVGSSARKQS